VGVDEARRHDQPGGVDPLLGRGLGEIADRGDATFAEAEVGAATRVPSISMPPAITRS
jgi:hypothetical protein